MLTPGTPVEEGLGEGEAVGVGVGVGLGLGLGEPQPGFTVPVEAWVHAACALPIAPPEMVSVAIGNVSATRMACDLSRFI
jgi:hypothetical protein